MSPAPSTPTGSVTPPAGGADGRGAPGRIAAVATRPDAMSPSRPFILRPVATTLLMVAILLSGIIAYRFLPLSALPEVDYPTIQVQTFYPGASPDVMTSSVTAPLEVQLGQMPALNQMSSASSAGSSVITLQFNLKLSLDVAEQEVQAAINAAGNLLPSDLPAPPIYAKVNPADAPILTLALTSKTLPLPQVEDLADTRLAQKISQLPGVGLVSISGGQRPAVRIQADLRKLAAYGLNIDDLRTTLGNANVNTPKGNFDGPMRASTINANDQLMSAADYRNLVIAYRNGSPVRLTDVANAVDGAQNDKLAAWMNTSPAVILNVQRQPGANVIEVVDSIKALLPQLQASLPAAVDVVRAHRPHRDHPRLGRRRRVRADARRRAGGAGDLRVPAQRAGDHHSEPVGAAVAGRHVRRDVSAGLQPQQSVADGADDRDGLRRRRRHRHDREHLALHRGGRIAARGGAQGLRADRLHHHLADGLADRGADPAAVHGRRGRPAVPRVRDHARGDDPDLGGGVADPGADAVRQAARSRRPRSARTRSSG